MKLQGEEWLLQDHFSFSESRAVRPEKRPPIHAYSGPIWTVFLFFFTPSFFFFFFGTRIQLFKAQEPGCDQCASRSSVTMTSVTVRPTLQWAQQWDPPRESGVWAGRGPLKTLALRASFTLFSEPRKNAGDSERKQVQLLSDSPRSAQSNKACLFYISKEAALSLKSRSYLVCGGCLYQPWSSQQGAVSAWLNLIPTPCPPW